MIAAPVDDRRLARLSEICLALPEATRACSGQYAAFRVRGRTFAYYLKDHHGDGIVALNCKAPAGQSDALVRSEPDRFHTPSYLGSKGWLGFRLDLGGIDWTEVADFVVASYCLIAPNRLSRLIDGVG